jgi:hypothetical protein
MPLALNCPAFVSKCGPVLTLVMGREEAPWAPPMTPREKLLLLVLVLVLLLLLLSWNLGI